jgi:hypothetical protein
VSRLFGRAGCAAPERSQVVQASTSREARCDKGGGCERERGEVVAGCGEVVGGTMGNHGLPWGGGRRGERGSGNQWGSTQSSDGSPDTRSVVRVYRGWLINSAKRLGPAQQCPQPQRPSHCHPVLLPFCRLPRTRSRPGGQICGNGRDEVADLSDGVSWLENPGLEAAHVEEVLHEVGKAVGLHIDELANPAQRVEQASAGGWH